MTDTMECPVPLVTLRVELPAYSHSFLIHVPPTSTILDVKHEIANSCIGNPQVNGQRIVWRGRYLKDEEKIEGIWRAPDETRTVHLAVNPTAWSSAPPEVPSAPPRGPVSYSTHPSRPQQQGHHLPRSLPHHSSHAPQPPSQPLTYIHNKHRAAIAVLSRSAYTPETDPASDGSRAVAYETLYRNGINWPSIFDEICPPNSDSGESLVYEHAILDGKPYLKLLNPGNKPTPSQVHALKVLTYTFPLLSLTAAVPPTPTSSQQIHTIIIPANVNAFLQQIGIHLRLPHTPNAAAQHLHAPPPLFNPHQNLNLNPMREVRFRILMLPLVMLVLRTSLLLYFVSPTQKPLFALLVGGWITYEAYGLLRRALGLIGDPQNAAGAVAVPPARDNAPGNANANNEGNGVAARPAVPIPLQGQAIPAAGRPRVQIPQHPHAVFVGLATMNLASEDAALTPNPVQPAPGLVHKTVTFVGLLLLSVHPVMWDWRRKVLREREGRLRIEWNAIEATAREDRTAEEAGDEAGRNANAARNAMVEQHMRRPGWVREYVERVGRTEWMEDL